MDPSSGHRKTLKIWYDGDNEKLQKLFKLLSNMFMQILHILSNVA